MTTTYLQQSTDAYLSAFPAEDGRGKWHAATKITGVSYCGSSRSTVVLDTTGAPIIVMREGKAHPIVCKRCVSYWRAERVTA